MKKVFKKLHKEVAENQINNRFDNPEEVNHFIFLTKKPNEEAKYLSCYHDEELEKMLYKMASENKGFFDVMKKVVTEIEKPKWSYSIDLAINGESMQGGILAALKSCQELNKQKEASRHSNCSSSEKYPSGGIINGKQHEEFVLPKWRTPSEIHEQALKDNLKFEKGSPATHILPLGTVYHDVGRNVDFSSRTFDDKQRKVYFYFTVKETRRIRVIEDLREFNFAKDKMKIYWKWAG